MPGRSDDVPLVIKRELALQERRRRFMANAEEKTVDSKLCDGA